MNTALIMLGSNLNPESNFELAIEKLAESFDLVSQSSLIISKPVSENYKGDFQNMALKILSPDTADETISTFKQIESDLGRTPESKHKGLIPIDIDMIFWNQNLVHQDYSNFDFVKICIDELI